MEGSAQGWEGAGQKNKGIFSSPAHKMQWGEGGLGWTSATVNPGGLRQSGDKSSPLPRIRPPESHTSGGGGGGEALFQQRSARHTHWATCSTKAPQIIAPEVTKVRQRHSGKKRWAIGTTPHQPTPHAALFSFVLFFSFFFSPFGLRGAIKRFVNSKRAAS